MIRKTSDSDGVKGYYSDAGVLLQNAVEKKTTRRKQNCKQSKISLPALGRCFCSAGLLFLLSGFPFIPAKHVL